MLVVLLCVLAAVLYGILHDLVTAHICVEYFTVAHPVVVASKDPLVMAVVWGVLATWWVGLILGVGLSAAANLGTRPKTLPSELIPPIERLLMQMALLALVMGVAGSVLAHLSDWPLPPGIDSGKREAFYFDAFAHLGSYLGGFLGGSLLILRTWIARVAEPRHLMPIQAESA